MSLIQENCTAESSEHAELSPSSALWGGDAVSFSSCYEITATGRSKDSSRGLGAKGHLLNQSLMCSQTPSTDTETCSEGGWSHSCRKAHKTANKQKAFHRCQHFIICRRRQFVSYRPRTNASACRTDGLHNQTVRAQSVFMFLCSDTADQTQTERETSVQPLD